MKTLILQSLTLFILIGLHTCSDPFPHCLTDVKHNIVHAANFPIGGLLKAFKASTEVLGQGSFGQVKALEWKNAATGESVPVAVKRIIVKNDKFAELLGRETDILAELKNVPGMLQMFSCMQTKEIVPLEVEKNGKKVTVKFLLPVIYIVLEKLYSSFEENSLEKESPFEILKARDLVDRLKVYKQIAEVLASLHRQNYVHSDFKPANFMATDKDLRVLKLIDFGFADKVNQPYSGSSPLYKPIEGFQKQPLKFSFDTYAFGVSIGELELGFEEINAAVKEAFKYDKADFVKLVSRFILQELAKKGLGDPMAREDNLTKIVADCLKFKEDERPSDEEVILRLSNLIEKLSQERQAENFNRGVIFQPHDSQSDFSKSEKMLNFDQQKENLAQDLDLIIENDRLKKGRPADLRLSNFQAPIVSENFNSQGEDSKIDIVRKSLLKSPIPVSKDSVRKEESYQKEVFLENATGRFEGPKVVSSEKKSDLETIWIASGASFVFLILIIPLSVVLVKKMKKLEIGI